jgi:DNA-binding Lrp family transcriptional regulator
MILVSKEIALDPTDVEILKMLTFNSGTSYSTIASSLDITVNTVKNRIRRIVLHISDSST